MNTQTFSEFYNKTIKLNHQIFNAWQEYTLFTWRWWVGILLIIIPTLLWLKYRKKESKDRLQFAGLFVAFISANLDYVGTFFGWWKYDYEVFPAVSNYIPFSSFALPITVMFFLQIKPKTSRFIKALLFAVYSIIALPFVHWIGIYDPVKWHYYYSFFIQFFIYLMADSISRMKNFKRLEE
ncbi:MAG: CBO0543 family protein [Bacillus sp. (in: firmicutes)]